MTDAPAWPVMSIQAAHAQLTAPGQRFEMEEQVIRGVATRVWKNAPPTLRDVFLNGRAFGEREFLINDDERVSYETYARATITLAHRLAADGVATAIHYPRPIHLQPAFAHLGQGPGSCPVAERAADEMISLPMFPELTIAQVDHVAASLRRALLD